MCIQYSEMPVFVSTNAGSSSIKLSAFVVEQDKTAKQIANCQISNLTDTNKELKYSRYGCVVTKNDGITQPIDDISAAFRLLIDKLVDDDKLEDIQDRQDISVVCHRVVHGGDFETPQVVTDKTFHDLEQLVDLAPLHNTSALSIIKASMKELPMAKNIACFDSEYHTTIPKHISTYPIDPEIAKKNKLRKYGFHGLSYSFIAKASAKCLNKQLDDVNIIALHLGSGASACAIKGGKSWDTSMGLTPVAGLPGATRSGSIDPSLVFHYTSEAGRLSSSSTNKMHISHAEEILNKQSGWKALTGTTNFASISQCTQPQHQLAFDIFVDRVCAYIGSYYVTLGGQVDALVFAGGIGEKSARLRQAVVDGVSCLGFAIKDEHNERGPTRTMEDISGTASKHSVLICQTDEELEMVRKSIGL